MTRADESEATIIEGRKRENIKCLLIKPAAAQLREAGLSVFSEG